MKYRLGDSLYIKGRIGWKGLKRKEYLDKGDYRIINGTNIINGKINWSGCGFISKERYNESPEIMLKPNDILITKDGTIGKVAMVEELSKPSTVASGIFILRNTSPNTWITKYLYYYLQSYDFKAFIHSQIEGSVIPHLYQKDFESLSIKNPSLEEQNTISRRLELIDKKIDLNNQINDNLVNFIQELFSQFNTCSKVPLKNIATISSSKRIYAKDYTSKGIPFYRGKEISLLSEGIKPDNNLFISPTKFKEINKKKPSPQSDDILITAVGTIGNIYQVEKSVLPFYFKDGNVIAIKPKTIYSNYLFYWLKSNKGQDQIKTIMIGSTQKALTINSISKLLITLPSKDELKQFNNIINPLKEQISKNKKENNTLLEFRQLLLNLYF